MKILVIILFTIAIDCIKLFSQSDYRKGYIIKLTNDTVYGLIDYRGEIRNSKKCVFKVNGTSEAQTFTPTDIKAYRFTEGKYYISMQIEFEGKKMQVFMEYLLNGIVSLYRFRDENWDHYYIQKEGGALYLLEIKKRYIGDNGDESPEVSVSSESTSRIREYKQYIGILKVLFKESPEVQKKVETVGLNSKSLIDISKEYHYNVCHDRECIVYEKQISKFKVHVGPLIGINHVKYSKIIIDNNISQGGSTASLTFDKTFWNKLQFTSLSSADYGLFFNFEMPSINEKLSLQIESFYYSLKMKGDSYTFNELDHFIYLNDVKLEANGIKNCIKLQYAFPKWKVRPIINCGFYFTKYLSPKIERQMTLQFNSTSVSYPPEKNKIEFSKTAIGFMGGIGFKFNAFRKKEVFLNFTYSNSLGNYDLFSKYGVATHQSAIELKTGFTLF